MIEQTKAADPLVDPTLFPRAGTHRSGDKCPGCGGYLGIYCSRYHLGFRIRYLHCPSCKYRPRHNQWVIPLTNLAAWQAWNYGYQKSNRGRGKQPQQ
jgi:ssDNA-binding Zn-finger/Zn-ribbon topoisomerase 1